MLMFFGTKVTTIPIWAFGLATTLISVLVMIIGWFVRRELQKKEIDIDKLQNVLYGYTGKDGTRKAGIMERFEELSLKFNNLGDHVTAWEEGLNRKQEEVEKNISVFQNDLEVIRKRVESSENWMLEEGQRNRRAIEKVTKSTEDTQQTIAHILGKLDLLISLFQKKE